MKLDSLRWFFQRRLAEHHIFGGAHPGRYDPQIRTRPRFLYNAPTPKFYHPMFTRSAVTVLTITHTNKQTPLIENIKRSSLYAATLGKKLRV